jgi:PST family polysaccharide transporter
MATVPCSNELAASSLECLPQPATATRPRQQSYGQILKSSALVGGSSVLNIGIGIVRTKTMALLLGPAGFGLFGLYGSIADLTVSIAGMGINSSGVRQIAEAVGSGDQGRIARTAAVLRRTSVALGVVGATLLLGFSIPVSRLTFGKAERAAAVSMLSIAVLFRLVSGGQTALIQGMRRIADLAKMNFLGALFGVCTSIPLVYFFREKGVVPSLVSVAAMTIVTSWWYSRKIGVQPAAVTYAQVRQEASALLGLGSAFMASGFLTMGAAYVVRIAVLHNIGFEATGLYQCAWTLGGLYVGIILQAMGADFYPRLTASVNNNKECNRLVNEQTLVGLLVAGPGVLATLSFAPLVISLLYSAKFGAAVGILRWICLGATLQVITWPMGFIVVAKGKQGLFILSELCWTIVAVGLAWFCVKRYGVEGAGISFFGSYVFHGVLTYPIAFHLTGFRWSVENKQKGAIFLCLIGIVFGSFYVLPPAWAAAMGAIAAVATGVYSTRGLLKLISLEQIPRPLLRLLVAIGFCPSAS